MAKSKSLWVHTTKVYKYRESLTNWSHYYSQFNTFLFVIESWSCFMKCYIISFLKYCVCLIFCMFIIYLLQPSKLSSNLATKNNTQLLSHTICEGQEFWKGTDCLSESLWGTRGLSQGCVVLADPAVNLKAPLGPGIHLQAHLHCCWQASVSHWLLARGFSFYPHGLLTNKVNQVDWLSPAFSSEGFVCWELLQSGKLGG